jgi:nitroreductase
METMQAVRSRRNVRSFTAEAIGQEDLDAVLEAGWRAPSSKNRQWWDFVVVTEPSKLGILADCWQGASWISEAAVAVALVAPLAKESGVRESVQYDLGQVTMAMMLAATDRGIGTGQAYVDDQDLARTVLGYPSDRFCGWLLALGHPADRELKPIKNPNRRPMGEVVHIGAW